ncbi:MAG: hypothetical protein HZB79_03070 [Deltaproteobacteria bacterium]|nr:hypothetical protein [Deltaproteobacteria bacterium]
MKQPSDVFGRKCPSPKSSPHRGEGRVRGGIFIWTEGGFGIGMGHVCRCIVIAKALRKKGCEPVFIINNDSAVIERVKKNGFKWHMGDFKNIPDVILELKTVFIDTKKDVSKVLQKLKNAGCKVILMDNTTDARLEADVNIFPSLIPIDDIDWNGSLLKDCGDKFKGKNYSGGDYIPIDEAFINARKKALNHSLPFKILVTMGGADPNRLTGMVVSVLKKIKEPIEIRVVIGPASSKDEVLDKIEKENDAGILFFRGQDDLSDIMADSHIAITALGTTLYELALVGVPAIIVANYLEDKKDMDTYKELGMNLPLGYYKDVTEKDICSAVNDFIKNKDLWLKMRQKGWDLISGKGAERIAKVVEGVW